MLREVFFLNFDINMIKVKFPQNVFMNIIHWAGSPQPLLLDYAITTTVCTDSNILRG